MMIPIQILTICEILITLCATPAKGVQTLEELRYIEHCISINAMYAFLEGKLVRES